MLDSFAKRLNSQFVSSPGDISASDRWAIGGGFKPTVWRAGAITATLGALVASLVGSVTSPPSELMTAGDRLRVQHVPKPGLQTIFNRYAYATSFNFEGEGTASDNRDGRISSTLGALTASFRGSLFVPLFQGNIAANLGALTASFRGTAYVDHFFDVEYSVTPTYEFSVMPQRSGQILATLGSLTASLRGVALPPDSTDGRIVAALGALTASLRGTHTLPPGRSGRIHADLAELVVAFRGASVPPQGVVGGINATLGSLVASFVGSTLTLFDGRISATLGPLTSSLHGAAFEPGTIVGLINAELGPLSVLLQGGVAAGDTGYLVGTVAFRPALEATVRIESALTGTPTIYPVT